MKSFEAGGGDLYTYYHLSDLRRISRCVVFHCRTGSCQLFANSIRRILKHHGGADYTRRKTGRLLHPHRARCGDGHSAKPTSSPHVPLFQQRCSFAWYSKSKLPLLRKAVSAVARVATNTMVGNVLHS